MVNTMRLVYGIEQAALLHGEQERKAAVGVHVPYLEHLLGTLVPLLDLLGTGETAEEAMAFEAIALGGLFHDGKEDRDMSRPDLLEMLGEEVGGVVWSLVEACSEDKSLEWEVRQRAYLASFATIPLAALPIRLADKLNSLRSLARQLRSVRLLPVQERAEAAATLWERFHAGPTEELAFYREVAVQALQRLARERESPPGTEGSSDPQTPSPQLRALLVQAATILVEEVKEAVGVVERLHSSSSSDGGVGA